MTDTLPQGLVELLAASDVWVTTCASDEGRVYEISGPDAGMLATDLCELLAKLYGPPEEGRWYVSHDGDPVRPKLEVFVAR